MDNSNKYDKKQINKKKICIWVFSIALVILLVSIGICKISGLIKVFPKDREVFEEVDSRNYNSEKIVSIAPTPSLTTLNEIEDWLKNEERNGEEFKKYNYALTQYYGIHIGMVNEVLSHIGEIKDENDAENVIAILESFPREFNYTINALRENEENGIIPPKFIITQVEGQIIEFKVKNVRKNSIYLAYKQRLISLNINDEYKQELLSTIEKVIKNEIYPSYNELLSYFKKLKPKANNDAGVWKFENGDEYYAYILGYNTSQNMTPQAIYDLGLLEINRIQADIEQEFKKLNYGGTLMENMKSLNNDVSFLYPQDTAGEEKVVNDYEIIINDMYTNIGMLFDITPGTRLKVLPISEFTEKSSPQAYYYPSLTGGDTPAIFYVNVSKPTYKYDMQSIAYHEALPGHHMQMALQSELLSEEYSDKSNFYIPAYVEGWGLYAERLADEYGLYKDPYSRLGYLRGELLRAVRLAVDTGIHYKRWTREYAIEYMTSFGCIPDEYVTAEVDRYIVNPGQACSYKIGEMKIIELREKAKAELREKFNIKDFHNVILRNGPMPLEIMEKEVLKYIDIIK
ncbi:MAG: hypothetical protein K0R09_3247 [Clostridiales bacterium]|nr:hypothetical protein [Clostridiales bacterium]